MKHSFYIGILFTAVALNHRLVLYKAAGFFTARNHYYRLGSGTKYIGNE